jgi:hypothetical protein
MYKMMTAKETVDYLFELPRKERELSFTFDGLDMDPDCAPSGYHGIKMTQIFDEFSGVFAIGYWGGGSTVVYDIYSSVDDGNRDYVKEFCAQKLQEYMNDCWDSYGNCTKICVEIKGEY